MSWPFLGGSTVGASSITPIVASGQIFKRDGQPWRWKGTSAFQLLDRFAKGQDILPFLDGYPGYNLVRVFTYVPAADWGDKAWDTPPFGVVVDFLVHCASVGFYVEITLLTDDDPARIEPAAELISYLKAAGATNLVLEAANEPQVHKNIDTAVLSEQLAKSGFQHASGDGDDGRWYGTYGTHHPPRDDEWPRKAKDALEFYTGQGPTQPHPPYRAPWVLDEGIRLDQAHGDVLLDHYAYAAVASICGAGATCHSNSGKFATVPNQQEQEWAQAMLRGLNVFPANAPLGTYRRIDELGTTLRTYIVGNYMVRVRPKTLTAPEPGWTPLDDVGVCWKKGQ